MDKALSRLEKARPFAKTSHQASVLDIARRMLQQPGGVERLYVQATRMDAGGLFQDTDWDRPETLLPSMVRRTMESGKADTIVLECMSQLRLLAIANNEWARRNLPAEHARHFLSQVLALNLHRLFGADEVQRTRLGALDAGVSEHFRFLADHVGYDNILGDLVNEIWRILAQRPVQVDHVKAMVTEIALTLSQKGADLGDTRLAADRLINALFGPTHGTVGDLGIDAYRAALTSMDEQALQHEAGGFARAMLDTGLVSDYHADFLRWCVETGNTSLVGDALGLTSTGVDALRNNEEIVRRLIAEAVYPETAQAVLGLSMMLERGLFAMPPIVPALWQQISLPLSPQAATILTAAMGPTRDPRVHLLAGVIMVLGLPLGVGQGNNPTCQSARAISMWSQSDPDFLLYLVSRAASEDSLTLHFEGQPIASTLLPPGLALTMPLDTDPVSLLLVPHLDRIYSEMGRLCAGRGEDPHKWINPELHGWWVGRDFVIAVDIANGQLKDYDAFLNRFFCSYHPDYNGNQPLIHPQPAGIAITDSAAEFVGWHAITIIRVAPDPQGVMRVYFYNPNNDGGQNWGNDVIVSTQGNGERFGESSLPFDAFVSRLYIFHDEPLPAPLAERVPADLLARIHQMAVGSWAASRQTVTIAATE